jgi:hypothetical protein
MGLNDGMSGFEGVIMMMRYALPAALVVALAVVGWRWVRRHEDEFVSTEPGDGDPEEHHEPPQ